VVISAQFSSTLEHSLAGRTLSPAARVAAAQARRQTLARGDALHGGPQLAHAIQAASVHAFHVGIGIAATLVGLGGLLGLAAIRNPRRIVLCADCAGGQLAGQPLDAARRPAPGSPPEPDAAVAVAGARTS
jgi:hypothetical protein